MRDGPDNPARPAPGVRLCAVAEIADPGSKGFRFRVENRLFAGMAQPLKGVLLIVCAKLAMFGMYFLYAWAAPMLARAPLASGAPGYDLELWVATAMLGITFPLIIAFTGFFDFWPLKRRS